MVVVARTYALPVSTGVRLNCGFSDFRLNNQMIREKSL